MKVVHVTTHLGGGIGTVLINWIRHDVSNQHTILCLNWCYSRNVGQYDNVHEHMSKRGAELYDQIEESDVVIVHFWNHPLLFDFLVNFKLPPCRLHVWSHVSGLHRSPYVLSDNLASFADSLVFSSPISYSAPTVSSLPDGLKGKTKVIWTAGDMSAYSNAQPIPHPGLNVGYVGTLDYSKIHPRFADICGKLKEANFIVCGGGGDADDLKAKMPEAVFTGVIPNVVERVGLFDAFGYLLNRQHFGTCEQVLGEAMAAGVVPVTLDNAAEKYILEQASMGDFVCSNEDQYVLKLLSLLKNRPEGRIDEMMKRARRLYSTENMISCWNELLSSMPEKRARRWGEKRTETGYSLFLESIGREFGGIVSSGDIKAITELFKGNRQWTSLSKGSPFQYLDSFPGDRDLERLCDIAKSLK